MIVTPFHKGKSEAAIDPINPHRDYDVPINIGAHIPDTSAMQLVDDEPGWEPIPWDEDLVQYIRAH